MPQPKLSKAVEGFLLSKSANGQSSYTIRNYRKEMERFVDWVGDIPIDKVNSEIIQNYLKYLKDDFLITYTATTPIKPRRLSPKSLRNTWGTLSSFWRWTVREFQITSPFNIPPIKAQTKPIASLNLEELEKLLQACESCFKGRFLNHIFEKREKTYLGKVSKSTIWQCCVEPFLKDRTFKDEPFFVHNDGNRKILK
jgi:site-specific recombinase XerD